MSKKMRRIFMGANMVLLLVVCYVVVTIVNGQAAEVTERRISGLCNYIVKSVESNGMTLEDARSYVISRTAADNSDSTVSILNTDGKIWIETDTDLLTNKATNTLTKINCSEIVTS